jgi:hypothetical protein
MSDFLNSGDPEGVLKRRGSISERQLILFGCACCRRQPELVRDEVCLQAVEIAERLAIRLATRDELQAARAAILAHYPHLFWPQDYGCHWQLAAYFATFDDEAASAFEKEHPMGADFDDMHSALKDEIGILIAVSLGGSEEDFQKERQTQGAMLRDIVGNLFYKVPLDVSWLVPPVLRLAESMYHSKRFDKMPELGSVLRTAGCTDENILRHCATADTHVMGCWVLDLLLRQGEPY